MNTIISIKKKLIASALLSFGCFILSAYAQAQDNTAPEITAYTLSFGAIDNTVPTTITYANVEWAAIADEPQGTDSGEAFVWELRGRRLNDALDSEGERVAPEVGAVTTITPVPAPVGATEYFYRINVGTITWNSEETNRYVEFFPYLVRGADDDGNAVAAGKLPVRDQRLIPDAEGAPSVISVLLENNNKGVSLIFNEDIIFTGNPFRLVEAPTREAATESAANVRVAPDDIAIAPYDSRSIYLGFNLLSSPEGVNLLSSPRPNYNSAASGSELFVVVSGSDTNYYAEDTVLAMLPAYDPDVEAFVKEATLGPGNTEIAIIFDEGIRGGFGVFGDQQIPGPVFVDEYIILIPRWSPFPL